MRQFRVSDLLTVILVLAVGLAALNAASATWAGVVVLLTVGLLLSAALGAVLRRGEGRAFCLGFTLFGLTYFLACFAPWFSREVGPWLPTSRLLDELYGQLHTRPPQSSPDRIAFWDYHNREVIQLNPYSFWVEGRDHFRRSGHCLATLGAAIIGGLAGWWQQQRSVGANYAGHSAPNRRSA